MITPSGYTVVPVILDGKPVLKVTRNGTFLVALIPMLTDPATGLLSGQVTARLASCGVNLAELSETEPPGD